MELLLNYGFFLARAVTVVVAIVIVVGFIFNLSQRKRAQSGQLKVSDLGDEYRKMKDELMLSVMDNHQQKRWLKVRKKQANLEAKTKKQRQKQGPLAEGTKAKLYVLDFKGSMDAHEVASLREEISAIIAVAESKDEVLLRLESPGGVVHGYGLAASQLQRLRQKGMRITAAVDKVAASGGYMMACVADHIVAAPFAIIGSIGVVAQIPNFNRLLKRNDIDLELHTAGEYKRTLTLFGENSEQGREKFRADLNETHQLFKQFVLQMRPSIDIDHVATGEHWFGSQALEKGLVDGIGTSDELLINAMENFEVISVRYTQRKRILERFTTSTAHSVEKLLMKIWQQSNKPLL